MFPIHGQVMFKLCMLTSLRTNVLRKFNHMRWKSEIFYTSEHFLKRNIWSTFISLNSRSTLWNPMIAFSNTVISSSAAETEPREAYSPCVRKALLLGCYMFGGPMMIPCPQGHRRPWLVLLHPLPPHFQFASSCCHPGNQITRLIWDLKGSKSEAKSTYLVS